VNFLEIVRHAREYLRDAGRVSLRALRVEYSLDDEKLDALVDELVDVQEVATRKGDVLLWSGSAVAGQRPAIADTRPADVDPRSYTPQHLADKILQSKSALEGERKQVTVVFADVKGSMELAEQIDAEEWHEILESFFEILTDGIHRFEGTVNQYTGDGIMALFGAPLAHEDHAQRACYAALHIQPQLAEQAREVKRRHGLQLSTRVGIHTGEVVVGKIGDDLRMDYTAQGHTVGLAARVEALASPDTIYLTETTAARVSGLFELDDLGEFNVKGSSEPVHAFELRGLGALRTRFDVSRARGLTRFVGRDADMQTLDSALEQARAGNGQVVGVVAEAGTGKSRLCFEFAERCRARHLNVFEGQAVAHGKNIPLLPILQVFRAYFGISEADDQRTIREKIAGRLLLLDEAFRQLLPIVFDFFGAPDPERPAPQMDPEARQRQLFAVVRRTLQVDVNQEPNITLIEDLHWMDGASELMLSQLVDALASSRSLLILNFRPEYRADWMQVSYYRQLPLAPLGPEAIRELLDDLLGNDPSTSGLADAIHGRTGGNPFFTEEIVQMLVESGQLEGTRGAYRLSGSVDRLAIPDTVQTLLASRIDRLEEREKQLLQTASVIGREFPEAVLERVADLPRGDLEAALSRLRGGEFVYQKSLYPISEYAFKHPLTHEVAVQSQLQERRRRTHAAVARAIIEVSEDRLDERSPVIAHHWEEAAQSMEAARWRRRAAEWIGFADPVESLRHWEKVRSLCSALDGDDEADRMRMEACRSVLARGWRLGHQGFDAIIEEGENLARRFGDTREMATLRLLSGIGDSSGGANLHRALEVYSSAVVLAEEAGDDALALLARWQTAYGQWCVGMLQASLDGFADVMERTEGDFSRSLFGNNSWVMSYMIAAIAAAWRGRVEQARAFNERAVALAREGNLIEELGWSLSTGADIAMICGEHRNSQAPDLDRAVFEGLEIAERLGSNFSRASTLNNMAASSLLHERWTEAIEASETALEIIHRENTFLEGESWVLNYLTCAYLGAGHLGRARETALETVAVAERVGSPHYEAFGHLLRARVELQESGAAARELIESELARSAKLVEQSGALGLSPQIRETEARLAAACGDAERCEQTLREALALYEQIGATGHAARLSAELAVSDGLP
jgi:class 3 adenylate cyclase/tetratricopeptide (TPR) repeat protein